MRYLSLKKRNGYTLLELLISISIFVIISVIVMNNFRQGQKMDDLRTGAVEMANNFREVQNLGMSGQVVKVCNGGDNDLQSCTNDSECTSSTHPTPPNGTCGLVPIGGFGIVIGPVQEPSPSSTFCYNSTSLACPTSYTLFADIADIAGKYDLNDLPLEGKENYTLPNNVIIRDFRVVCTWATSPGNISCPIGTPYGVHVSFRPPKPTPFFHIPVDKFSQTYAEQTINIMLQHTSTLKCRMVTINGVSGEVSEAADANCSINT